MIGPFRHKCPRPESHNGQLSHGNFARAATRSPTLNRVTPGPTSTIRTQNSCPNNCTGASVSSRFLIRSNASVRTPAASCASVTLGCTTSTCANTCRGFNSGIGTSSNRKSLNP